MKFSEALNEAIALDLQIRAVPALIGEVGIGKSSFVSTLAMNLGTKAFTLACNELADKADLTGGRLVPYTTTDGEESYKQVFYPHAIVMEAIEYAKANSRETPILFLDEINRSTSDVTSAALSIPTTRRIGSIDLPENLRVMIAGNDKGNVTALDEASLTRFAIYRVEPDAPTLIGILGAEINPHVKAVLTKFPHLVFQKSASSIVMTDGNDDDDDDGTTVTYGQLLDTGEEMLQVTTPRTIHVISRWLNAVAPDKLLEYFQTQATIGARDVTMLHEIIEAHIGNTEFTTQLIAEIGTAISAGTTSQAQILTAPKPSCFASLKQAQSVTELEDLIRDLTDREKSGSLVYALFERQDNKVIIEQLAQQTTALEQDGNMLLVQLAGASLLDDGNVQVLYGTGSNVGEDTKRFLSMFMA